MSDKAMQVLDAIDGRRLSATRGGWRKVYSLGDKRYHVVADDQPGASELIVARLGKADDATFVEHAPADLALLTRLVRSVAEAECDGPQAWVNEPMRVGEKCDDPHVKPGRACHPCRIRRELCGEGVKA